MNYCKEKSTVHSTFMTAYLGVEKVTYSNLNISLRPLERKQKISPGYIGWRADTSTLCRS